MLTVTSAGVIAVIAALGGTAGIVKIINAIKKREATPETIQLMQDIGELKEAVYTLTQHERDFNLMYLRHSIMYTYYDYKNERKIPEYKYESTLGLYDVYKSLDGNGFVEAAIEEMKTWERV